MTSMPIRAVLVAVFFVISYAIAQDTSPTGPTQPNIAANCNAWHTVGDGDGCWLIETTYGISHEDFIKWNPDVSNDCTTDFWPDYAYCVGVGAQVPSTSKTSSSMATSSRSSTISSSIRSSTSSVITSSTTVTPNATYSIREPIITWNLTSSTIESVFPPQKTQAGQPSYCNNWHYVEVGNTCETIVGSTSWMTMAQFLEWNPELDNDCSGLYYGWWVCIGIQPQTVTATFEYTITAPPVEVPSSTAYTPTTFPPVNSSFTATPTQAGLAQNCQAFYQAKDGDTCRQVLQYNFFSEEEFFAWNPALQGNCDGLWVNYWYCVAAYESGIPLPTPPTVTTRPSPVPAGQIGTCTRWYKTGSETCDDIVAMFAAFSKTNFIAWNPSVGSSCEGIREGLFYCVGVPGTPTTRTSPVPTTTIPTETPMQSGIATDCSDFWLVSSSDTCESIANSNGITETQLFTWNPATGSSSCDNLKPNFYVCVGVGGSSTSASPPITPSSTTTRSGSSSTRISTTTTTTSSGGSVSTPVPFQSGMVAGCRRFYMAQSGDGCWAIADSAKIDLNDFYAWNPAVGTSCAGLWLDTWYCIGIAGPVTTISSGPPVPT